MTEEYQGFYVVVGLSDGEVCGINAFESLDDAKPTIDEWLDEDWPDDWLGQIADGQPPNHEVVVREVKLVPRGYPLFDDILRRLEAGGLENSELDQIAKRAAYFRDRPDDVLRQQRDQAEPLPEPLEGQPAA